MSPNGDRHHWEVADIGGTHHYKVWKDNEADTTTTHVTELTLEERIQEIANMLSGEKLTQAAINNAKSLLGAQSD